MTVSVFTPSHEGKRLPAALESLQSQSYSDWKWVVLLNNGGEFACDDPRVKICRDTTGLANVGYLKRTACEKCSGDILLELDHDDILLPGALEETVAAFGDPTVTFAYSNSVCHDSRTDTPVTWGSEWGWSSRPFEYKGKQYMESVSADPDPQSISRIWFAPNHLRAWRRTAYWEAGGHNATMKISDDHDLVLRTYLHGKMVHIDKPLYLYYVHGDNTWLKNQDEIQTTMWDCHDRYIMDMAKKWAGERRLRCLDICAGPHGSPDGFEGIDRHYGPIKADLDQRWPAADNSVGAIRAFDAVEHLCDPVHMMNEAWRVLAHGGFLFVAVPSTKGEGAWSDPTHRSFWNKRSFAYYTRPDVRQMVPALNCKFQQIKVTDGELWGVPFVFAHLVAIKADSPRFYGENLWDNGLGGPHGS